MAHVLSLLMGATTTTLTTGNNFLLEYVPQTPGSGDLEVTESARLHITAASKTALQTAVRGLEDFFSLVKRRQMKNSGDRGYVQLAVDGDNTTWRSEVVVSMTRSMVPSIEWTEQNAGVSRLLKVSK